VGKGSGRLSDLVSTFKKNFKTLKTSEVHIFIRALGTPLDPEQQVAYVWRTKFKYRK